jgi:hypothetical protein
MSGFLLSVDNSINAIRGAGVKPLWINCLVQLQPSYLAPINSTQVDHPLGALLDLVANEGFVVVAQRRSWRDDRRRRDHLFQLFDGQLDFDQDILISPVTS